MKIRSIKAAFRFFIAVIVFLSAIALFDTLVEGIMNREMEKLHSFLGFEKAFARLIVEEGMALNDSSLYPQVVELHETLSRGLEASGYGDGSLKSRPDIFRRLYDNRRTLEQHLRFVRQLLPELIASVRYIHGHHITYLKNLMRRGRATQDYDVGTNFSRSSVQAAPELDIISIAVAIQNHLLELLNIFNTVYFGDNPSTLKTAFQKGIQGFYDAVNTFEDYSLDAQDGLLVEELLMNGREFEEHFEQLLIGEIQARAYTSQLEANDALMLDFFKEERNRISTNLDRRSAFLHVLQYTGSAIFVLLIAVLVYLGRCIRRAFQRTVSETKQIQAAIDYHISIQKDDFSEFQLVYQALNAMAETIKKQVDDLEKARTQLSFKVKARTVNLERANQLLKREIEEREKAEQQRIELEIRLSQAKKMEAIGTLAGGVAHDLNNILWGIVTYPDFMLDAMPPDHDFRRPLEVIKTSGEKAAAIVQDLLTLARRGVKVSELTDFREIVRTYLNSPEFKKLERSCPGVQFVHHIISEPAIITGSSVHLEKTVMNLVTNAFEAIAQRGTVTLSIEKAYVDRPIKGYETVKEGDYIKLTVADNGVGIAANDLERVFEPFFTKKTMGRSGTGLGMAVVWGTVKDHDGYIDACSKEGEGTTFSLYFPESRQVPVPQKPAICLEEFRGEGQSILVVDDIAKQREIAAKILTRLGYQVVQAASGEEAVRYVRDNPVDLIILDMIMAPGMDGLDTYREVLSVRPGTRAIIASGFSATERVREAQKLGGCLYLRKPYTVQKIAEVVIQALAANPSCPEIPVPSDS